MNEAQSIIAELTDAILNSNDPRGIALVAMDAVKEHQRRANGTPAERAGATRTRNALKRRQSDAERRRMVKDLKAILHDRMATPEGMTCALELLERYEKY